MARFLYQARDGRGDIASGVLAAASLEAAGAALRSDGKFIVRLTAVDVAVARPRDLAPGPQGRRVRRGDVIFFAHQMAVMMETGVPIVEALDCVTDQAANPAFRAVLRDVTEQVQAGGQLSAALKRHPRAFPTVMISLVAASEVSGTMGLMLERVAHYLATEHRTIRQARGALMYPMFMLGVAAVVTVFLMVFVLPRFTTIYAGRGATLPAPTRLLMGVSETLTGYWPYWLAGLAAAGVSAALFHRSPTGRRCLDWLKLHTPVARDLFMQLYLTRACRTMGTMIASGVSMLDTVAMVRQVTPNTYFQELWDAVAEALQQGMQLSDPLFRSPLMPRSVVQMIRSGEKSGRLGTVLSRVADHTEQEFEQAVKNTTQFIEPALVVVMGALVGFIAISLLLPIFSVSKVVAGQ